MAFTPIRMVSKDGRECLVGSAIEREQLRAKGYKPVPESQPEPKRTPAPAPTKKTDTK
ncbi:hypothetical protein [Nocardia niwae]|uniref:hypothetical protein n=1 Tax=Nocardia niwae TaxID=626084 RepID=UPI000A514C35|nr:hypothetical protein [Nocardia niwae]